MRHQSANSDCEVAKVAASQYGVVSIAQLREAGLDKSAVKRRALTGRLHPIHRGVYAVGHPHLSAEGRWMAAVLAYGTGAVLSHRAAASAWRLLPDQLSAPIDVSVPSDTGKKIRHGIRLHRCPSLEPKAVTRHRRIPITTPARTIIDLGKVASPADVRRARRQAGVLGLSVEGASKNNVTRSELEDLFLKLCQQYRLPTPEVNVRIAGLLVDFVWRKRWLIVETDGYRYHRGRASFEDDRARDLRLRSHGFEVIRLTYNQVAGQSRETANVLSKLLSSRPETVPSGRARGRAARSPAQRG
jgi:very-short-patch-repair endonuclease